MEMLKILFDKLAGDLYGINLTEKTMEEKAIYAQILVVMNQICEKSHTEVMVESMRAINGANVATMNPEVKGNG